MGEGDRAEGGNEVKCKEVNVLLYYTLTDKLGKEEEEEGKKAAD